MPAHSKFTGPNRAAIIEALKLGHFARVACELVGIDPTTYHNWITRGEAERDDPDSEYARFASDARRAKAEAEADALKIILAAARETWQAAAWYLERSRPDRWAKKDWRKGQGDDDGDFTVDLSPSPPEESMAEPEVSVDE